MKIHLDLAALGGLAATSELLARDHDPEIPRVFSRAAVIIRVRKGWYCDVTASVVEIAAWRVGTQ